ncbi:MAG: C25 family cysteine peptidase [Candidatus Heimdallarchaeaceae archaeon]
MKKGFFHGTTEQRKIKLQTLFLILNMLIIASCISYNDKQAGLENKTTIMGFKNEQFENQNIPINEIIINLPSFPVKKGNINPETYSKWTLSAIPSAPQLPVRQYRLLLPPGVVPETVAVKVIDEKIVEHEEEYYFPASPLPVALLNDSIFVSDFDNMQDLYLKDAFWPNNIIREKRVSQLRNAVLLEFEFFPYQYNPMRNRIIEHQNVKVSIKWKSGMKKEADPLTLKFLADIQEKIDNFEEIYPEYEINEWKNLKQTLNVETNTLVLNRTYLIITTNAIVSNSEILDDFIRHKQLLGFNVKVITEDDYGTETGKQRALNIRSWLQDHYITDSIEYVLLIGNPNPDDEESATDYVGDVPMLMCWPRYGASEYDRSPTDYFYADLTGDWDTDDDGYYGEHGDDTGVDFYPEVHVGRIPVYSGDYTTLDFILNNSIYHHINAGAEKNRILEPIAISNYENEDDEGYSRTDGLDLPEEVWMNILSPIGMEDTVLYERSGLDPVPTSAFHYDMPLTDDNVIDAINDGYGAIFWWGHGNDEGVYRKYWGSDSIDNDYPDSSEMVWETFLHVDDMPLLETDQQAFFYQSSCLNGYPENSANLGYSLLKRGTAITTVSASRVSWYLIGTWNHNNWWSVYADNTGIGYYYMENLLKENMSAGEALFYAKASGGNGDYSGSWMNKMDFNLYGDPQLSYWVSEAPIYSNPSPTNGQIAVSTSCTLSVVVSDPDEDELTVFFYNATDDSLIGLETGIASGETVSVTLSGLDEGQTYSWYVIVTDGQKYNRSVTWTFTTNNEPTIPINPLPVNGSTGLGVSLTLSVVVSDPDGGVLNVSFYNASDDSLIGVDTEVISGETASITWSGLKDGTQYSWYVIVTDGLKNVKSDTWTFSTENAPSKPTKPLPSNNTNEVELNPTLSVEVSDPDGGKVNVSFYNAEDDTLIGEVQGVNSGEIASCDWFDLAEGKTYSWYVVVTDGIIETKSDTWSFQTLSTDPTWDEEPKNQLLWYGEDLIYDLDASDISGINEWWINNTINFDINSEGVLTNATTLEVGVYWLEIRAIDPYGNYCSATIIITVANQLNLPSLNSMAMIVLPSLVVLTVLSIVILVKVNKKK